MENSGMWLIIFALISIDDLVTLPLKLGQVWVIAPNMKLSM